MAWLSFLGGGSEAIEDMVDIFPLSIAQKDFVRNDVMTIYQKILTDVFERTQGLSEDDEAALWDSYVMTGSNYGLITLLSCAMIDKSELFLVYDKSTKVLRKAKADEEKQIRADYESQASSKAGVYVNFKQFYRTDMIMIYSALEFFTVSSLHKSMNISKAVQIKISDLRGSVALSDAAAAKAQAVAIANALKKGKDVYMDAKDTVENSTPDLTATGKSMDLANQKRSFYLGLPASYITGILNSGLGDSGDADARAIERGLKNYFYAIVKPVAEALFDAKLEFESEDYTKLESALNALKTFSLTDDILISEENKIKLLNKLFGLPDDSEGDPAAKATDVTPPASPGQDKTGKVLPPAKKI